MIHAYDKNYLSLAQKNLACMIDYMVNELNVPLNTAWQYFLMSEMSVRFERGDCSVVAGISGIELACNVLKQANVSVSQENNRLTYERSTEYWTGWAIAYYQWDTGLRFNEINHAVSIDEVCMMYNPYHEMDIRQFADKMNELYRLRKPETNLKRYRTLSGFSQSMLAERVGVPVRTIQQYEQRKKEINKAHAETLLRLAKVLNCNMEDLIEKIPVNN